MNQRLTKLHLGCSIGHNLIGCRKKCNRDVIRKENYMNQNFIYSLEIMGKGMLSIFAVIILLYLIVVLLGKVASLSKNSEEE